MTTNLTFSFSLFNVEFLFFSRHRRFGERAQGDLQQLHAGVEGGLDDPDPGPPTRVQDRHLRRQTSSTDVDDDGRKVEPPMQAKREDQNGAVLEPRKL